MQHHPVTGRVAPADEDRRSRRHRLTRFAALVAGCALLAACQTGEDPEPTDDAVVSPSPGPVETPSVEAEADRTEEPAAGAAVLNGPNSITSPVPGETVDGPVTVTGEGTAFEATLSYRVLVAGTDELVLESYTMAGANGEVAPYSFDVDLEPGDYTVQVWEADMSDGENAAGPYLNLVEVDFTVV